MKVCTACNAEYEDDVLFCQRDGTPLRKVAGAGDLVGQVVAERYHIQKKLGEGGMGQVYLAEHVKMGRRCAIKIMTPGMMSDPDAISRFNREAANASRISHPHVCAIYDFGETSDGLIYLAMEFIEGKSLTGLLEENGALPLARAAAMIQQAAEALQAAHDLGIVHRDLKPDNIMVSTARGKDTVKVVDFGIAKAAGGEDGGQKVTKTGFVVGTPEYMSPEQLSGDPVDGRSDVYSLGLVFYRMLTGTTPFPAESQQETMIKRLTDDPLPLAEVRPDVKFPPELQRVLDRVLSRNPGMRYPSAAEFGRDVRTVVQSSTGLVDVEAGTQVVRADDLKQAVPATRVDPAAARKSPPPPAAPAKLAPPARRGLPVVPIAAGVVAVALAVGGYAMKDQLLGGSGSDSLPGAVTPDTNRVETPADTGTSAATPGTSPGGTQQVDPMARPEQGGGTPTNVPANSRTGGEVTPPRRDSAFPPPVGPNLAVLNSQIDVYIEEIGFEDDDAKRVAGKRLGTQIFDIRSAPDTLRAKAAFVVATALMKEKDRDGARRWMTDAVRLYPSKRVWQQILDGI